ncbi:MAG TPA: RpiB/LacA/LacB family sugar-phosphate isomerase [Bacteroidales bacterium]|nr:RpiB/LacA/LacB family sugar-phosphate isomerase [Bacteroidales bacterium]
MVKTKLSTTVKRIGVAADHGGFELKVQLTMALKATGYDLVDFGAQELDKEDDYPDFVMPMARAVARGEVARGLAICGSGVGASVATDKMFGVHPPFALLTLVKRVTKRLVWGEVGREREGVTR